MKGKIGLKGDKDEMRGRELNGVGRDGVGLGLGGVERVWGV